jgi:stage V sporulation protein G
MEITEIRVFLKEGQDKKLKAYTTVTFDNVLVIRNIKVIQGAEGLFIAMPSRKLKAACLKCHFKNEVGSRFCNKCGASLPSVQSPETSDEDHDSKTQHRDIAHPITKEFREYMQKKILDAYQREAAAGPGQPH